MTGPIGLTWMLVSLVIIGVLAYFAFRKRKPGPPAPTADSTVTPAPSAGSATQSMTSLINVHDHDMRSLELGRWYVAKLRVQVKDRGNTCATDFDFEPIAKKVPRINDVTRKEVVRLLRELVAELCSTSPSDLVAELDAFERRVLDPSTGSLVGTPGYALKSSVPLPKP